MAIDNSPGAVVATNNASRTVWIAGGALALASIAAVAGIAMRPGNSSPEVPTAALAQSESALSASKAPIAGQAATPRTKAPSAQAPSA